MALAKNLGSNHLISSSNHLKSITPEAKAFIQGAEGSLVPAKAKQKKVAVLLRVDSELLREIDQATEELGLKRAAFIVSVVAIRAKKFKASGAGNS